MSDEKRAARILTPRIIWAALLASLGIYAGLLVSGVAAPSEGAEPLPWPLLVAVAASLAIASFLVPRFVHRAAIARTKFEIEQLPLNTAPTGYRTAGGHYQRLTPAVYDSAFAVYLSPLIISLALSEAVGALGFVAAMTGVPLHYCLAMLGVSALLIAVRFPTWRSAIAPIERETGAVAPPPP